MRPRTGYSPKKSCSCRIPFILALVIAASVLALPAAAHAPSDMVIVYDPVTEKLSVTITHQVDDPATHYVNKVQVRHNNRVISDPDYKSQPTKDTFTYTYDLKASPPDEFWVLSTCSRGGTLEKKWAIPRPTVLTPQAAVPAPAAQEPPAPTPKSPLGLIPVIGAVAFLLIRK